MFSDPRTPEGSRTPNIIVAPNVGVVYTGGKKKVAEHGGFAHDDTTVMMLVSHPEIPHAVIHSPVETAQVAPTILALLASIRQPHRRAEGRDPSAAGNSVFAPLERLSAKK